MWKASIKVYFNNFFKPKIKIKVPNEHDVTHYLDLVGKSKMILWLEVMPRHFQISTMAH